MAMVLARGREGARGEIEANERRFDLKLRGSQNVEIGAGR
jgi:hypothetical protein